MSDPLMTVDHLRLTQLKAMADTSAQLNGLVKAMPNIGSAMFQLAQKFAPESGPVSFRWWAYSLLISVPYTATEVFDSIHRASYFEATILYRHLLEAIVQLRYYEGHGDRFETDHEWELRRAGAKKDDGSRATRPVFKLMFDAVAPGHYEQFYSRWFSNAAHGGIVSSVFRFKGMKPEDFAHKPGAHFDVGTATYLLTHLGPVLHGLIRTYVRLHPGILDKVDATARSNVEEALRFLQDWCGQDWQEFPKKRPLLEQLSGLADWPKPVAELAPPKEPAKTGA